MKTTYQVFSTSNAAERKSKYYEECSVKGIVNVVAISKRKYTHVEWDFHTFELQNRIDSLENCSLEEDIRELYQSYIKKINLPKEQSSYMMTHKVGGFYIYNEDVEIILPKLCNLIDSMMESKCMKITPLEELMKDTPQEVLDALGYKA